jgi:hypothetical protein
VNETLKDKFITFSTVVNGEKWVLSSQVWSPISGDDSLYVLPTLVIGTTQYGIAPQAPLSFLYSGTNYRLLLQVEAKSGGALVPNPAGTPTYKLVVDKKEGSYGYPYFALSNVAPSSTLIDAWSLVPQSGSNFFIYPAQFACEDPISGKRYYCVDTSVSMQPNLSKPGGLTFLSPPSPMTVLSGDLASVTDTSLSLGRRTQNVIEVFRVAKSDQV